MLGMFSTIYYNRDNFWDFLFALLYTVPSEKGSFLKRKNLLPRGENSFLLEKIPFKKAKSIWLELPPINCTNSP